MYSFPVQPVDLFGDAPISRADVQIFTATQFSQGWQTWNKPRGVTQSYMLAISGGGGGGGGQTRAAGVNGGGGSGGACSGIARLLVPAFFLPEILYVQIGQGGLGGAGGAAGSAGAHSYISFGHSTANPNVLLASGGATAPGGGLAGVIGGAAGGTIPTIPATPINSIGHWFGNQGIAGGAGGGTAATPTAITAWGTIPLSPGAGGGGVTAANVAGANVIIGATAIDWGYRSYSASATIAPAGNITTDPNGGAGVMSWQPFFMCGGAGGASVNAGIGGSGGNGGIGCGGGGGGAGTTGGRGGNGGSGLVMIISW